MRFYKKLAFLILLPIAFMVNAQEFSDDSDGDFFRTSSKNENIDPDAGEDPTDDQIAPINDYAPLLVLGGIAVYAFSRKKFQLK